MAKSVTPEVVEAIITRVMEKFTDVLATITTNLTTMMRDAFNAQFTVLNARLDAIEAKIAQNNSSIDSLSIGATHPLGSRPPGDVSTNVVQELLKYEKEKDDIRRRARNVIVAGLPQQNSTSDVELVEAFCESHLTVKPHIISARRIGKNNRDPDAKLCVTLEAPEMVDDIISSATILRESTDLAARRVFFNRDLTKQQADAAYQLRCERRSKRMPHAVTKSATHAADMETTTKYADAHFSAASATGNSFPTGSL